MPAPVALDVSVELFVPADPNTLYDLVTDVTRMGEWSPETVRGRWLDGAVAAAPGVRFAGTNRLGLLRWTTKPRIDVADRGKRFAFTVPGSFGSRWSYTFDAVPGGTRITESMVQPVPAPALLRRLQAWAGAPDRAAHLAAGMSTTLHRLAAAVTEPAPIR